MHRHIISVTVLIFSSDPTVKMISFFSLIQEGSLAVEPVSPCFLARQEPPPPTVWLSDAVRGQRVIGKRHSSLSPHLIFGPDDSPLLLVKRHVYPPPPTIEICLWCKHPCLSPWQPSLLPAVGCHASRLPHALPHRLALYCSWHVQML